MVTKFEDRFSCDIAPINEPQQDKTNKLTCEPSEDHQSDQPGYLHSLIRVFACAKWVAKDSRFLCANNKDSDQTGRISQLIGVFADCSGHVIGFVMLRLKIFLCIPLAIVFTIYFHGIIVSSLVLSLCQLA